MLALKAPTLASDLLNGSASLSAVMRWSWFGCRRRCRYCCRRVVAAGGGIANSVGGAIKAGHAAFDHAKASGSTGIMDGRRDR